MTREQLSAQSQHCKLRVHGRSDVGRVRKHNEDMSYADPAGRFFVVADGMGGHAAGEVASQLAVEEAQRILDAEMGDGTASGGGPDPFSESVMNVLLERIARQANRVVREHASQHPSRGGMGTTLEVVLVTGNGAWIGHVGDSRTYLLRGHAVSQLTRDQTVNERLSAEQKEALGAASLKQWENVLAEAIGARDDVGVDVVHSELRTGDLLLLCSDGLYQYFPRATEIGEIVAAEGPKAGLDRLVDLALERGGRDNITGLLVEIVEFSPTVRRSSAGASTHGYVPIAPPPDVADRTALDQEYGIEEAIALMRGLPAASVELVLQVVRNTLASTDVFLAPIIRDAADKQQRIEGRITELEGRLVELRREVYERKQLIAALEADRDETLMVRDRLDMAMKLP